MVNKTINPMTKASAEIPTTALTSPSLASVFAFLSEASTNNIANIGERNNEAKYAPANPILRVLPKSLIIAATTNHTIPKTTTNTTIESSIISIYLLVISYTYIARIKLQK